MKKLKKKIFIKAQVELVTGLHIGDSKESVEIGGLDNPVVRRKDNNQPYIPGSSVKGKMRCLLDQVYGINPDGSCKNTGGIIEKLFGASENKKENYESIPSRLIVRDAYLTQEWAEKLKNSEYTDMPYTEVKFENVINRVKGTAEHPRQIERVPAGAQFELNFVINIFEGDDESKLLNLFEKGIELLQDDYLGGSGSRGYGQIKIVIQEKKEKSASEYMVN
jgi:CRISPR-associated protein Csm3